MAGVGGCGGSVLLAGGVFVEVGHAVLVSWVGLVLLSSWVAMWGQQWWQMGEARGSWGRWGALGVAQMRHWLVPMAWSMRSSVLSEAAGWWWGAGVLGCPARASSAQWVRA